MNRCTFLVLQQIAGGVVHSDHHYLYVTQAKPVQSTSKSKNIYSTSNSKTCLIHFKLLLACVVSQWAVVVQYLAPAARVK